MMAILQSVARSSDLSVNAILEGIGEGFFALDADWRFTAFNRAGEEIFGLLRNEVLGRSIWECRRALSAPNSSGAIAR